MIEAPAPCFVSFDRAAYESTMLFQVPPKTTDPPMDGQIATSERLWEETKGDPRCGCRRPTTRGARWTP